jgi:hypothetical protein
LRRFSGIFVYLLILISLTTQAGADMKPLTLFRLGKVVAGDDSDKPVSHHSLISSGSRVKRENIPVPIVLWNKDTWAAALYFSKEDTFDSNGRWSQKIDHLLPPVKGWPGLKAMLSDYPITFHDKYSADNPKIDERTMNFMEDIYTKDVNGDGVDELIVTRHFGDVEVYDRVKRIMKYTPHAKPKLFEYSMKDVNFTTLDNHDEVFFAAYRKPYGNVDEFSSGDKRYYETTRNCWIVRVCPQGITEIHPVFPDNSEPATIEAVIGMNKPGSKTVDELIVISTFKGKKDYYLSRHTLDGRAIDTPREIYGGYNMYCGAYGIPQSNQIIAQNAQKKILYFITPEKPVNWIKTITLVDLFGPKVDINIIGETIKNNLAVVVFENDSKLYAIDALGKFHTSMKPGSGTSDKPVSFLTLKPDSKLHRIIDITPTDKTMESFLVIQSRSPGKRELSLDQLEKAGERFLSDRDWKECKDELILEYDDDMKKEIKWRCDEKKIPIPDIRSMEDIKHQLPWFYDYKVKESQRKYRDSLETDLFRPIERKNYNIEDGNYKHKDEYKKWLNNTFVDPELVFSIQHLSNGIISRQKLENYYFEDMDTSGMTQPDINVRTRGERGQVFMVLHKKILDKDFEPAYYTIVW